MTDRMTTAAVQKRSLPQKHTLVRHALATLAYRGAKVVRQAPPDFSCFRSAPGSRTAGEILAHMGDLMDWMLSQARGKQRWRPLKPRTWDEDTARFFDALTALDQHLASDAEVHAPSEKMFQGAVADALTHVGQLALLRRLAGSPVRGENYYRAKIEIGRTSLDQPKAVSEFD